MSSHNNPHENHPFLNPIGSTEFPPTTTITTNTNTHTHESQQHDSPSKSGSFPPAAAAAAAAAAPSSSSSSESDHNSQDTERDHAPPLSPSPRSRSANASPIPEQGTTPAVAAAADGDDDDVDDDVRPELELKPFDWADLEARFGAQMEACDGEEERVGKEFDEWVELFKVWSSTAPINGDGGERARKRLRTRIASVQSTEEQFEEKRQHYIKVVQAFENALALLGGI